MTASRRERLLILAGVALLVLLAVLLRLVPTVFVPSTNWPDEVFQTVEPAHRLVYGYGLVPWEFQLGMRFWLLPGVIAGLMEIARIIGDGPQYYLSVIAASFALLACAPVVCVFLWCRQAFGLAGAFVAAAAVAIAPELVYFGARALNEVVAAHLLVVAIYLIAPGYLTEPGYLIEPGYRVSSRRRLFGAGVLLGVACLLRINLVPAAAVVLIWSAWGDWRSRLPALIGGGLLALAGGAVLDWLTLGYPLASIWRNLYDNIYVGVSSGFGVEPWFYYLVGELAVWLAAAPLVALLVALGARRMPMLLIAAATLIATHSVIGHKEYRFIYPAVVLLMVLAAVGLAQLTGWAEERLVRRGVRQGVATASAMILLLGFWGAIAFGVWSGPTLAGLRQRAHDHLAAISFARDMPQLCGVGLYSRMSTWLRYGGYTHLHRPVPMYWPEDESELAASAAAFDALLYEIPPPPQLGFKEVRCFGRICVARRAGGCAARATPVMSIPERLLGVAPIRGNFETIPERLRPNTTGQAQP